MNKNYYIELDGQQYGPYELEQMKDFLLFSDTLVCVPEENEEWRVATDFPELFELISTSESLQDESSEDIVSPSAINIFNTNYYYKNEEDQLYGPFSLLELIILDINENTLLGINNTENWHFAYEIEGLLDTLSYFSALEKEEYESELQRIRENFTDQTVNTALKNPISHTHEDDISKESLLRQINEYKAKMSHENKQRFTKSYPSFSYELLDRVEYYNSMALQFITLLNSLSDKTQNWISNTEKDYQMKNEVMSAVRNLIEQFNKQITIPFPDSFETSNMDNAVWTNLQPLQHRFPSSTFLIGKNVIDFALFDDFISFTKHEYMTLLDTKNIVAYYDKSTKKECFDFVNTLTGRLFMSSLAGKFSVTTIDTIEMEGISDSYKSLNKSVFIYSRENEIQQCFEKKTQYIENVIQNLLIHPVKNIGEYNQGKENPESYQLLIIKSFPVGLRESSLLLLKQIMKNGLRAGIHVVLLIDKDELALSKNTHKQFDIFDMDRFEHVILQYDFTKSHYPFTTLPNIQHFSFENLSLAQTQTIVRYINKSLETKPAEVVSSLNFLPPQSEWWSRNSVNHMEIPFGVSEGKELVSLAITQENGQNSAIVIGIPGSGKSVFLHTIITNGIIHYSPDELELYLMDFSGVEFNTYALHHLLHAKVIAPEAEREFGLSVLRELKEEGSRRMELCRNNEVSNIVDLKEKNPEIKIPRILAIIDEFQKLFEIENDKISQEAQSIIQIIIQEFRKFGINIILATQTLRNNPIRMDMIANRIVFKCSPNDVHQVFERDNPTSQIARAGECIYNAQSGAIFANQKVQTFFISKKEIDNLLNKVHIFSNTLPVVPKDVIIFRSNELPDFSLPDIKPQVLPDEVDIFFGEPIAILETDVFADLRKASNDNILIIGGEQDVAQRIAVYTAMSIMAAHTNDAATLYFFNFMRPTDVLYSMPENYYEATAFDTIWVSKTNEVVDCLKSIKNEIDVRRDDETKELKHIYLSIYAFQLAQMFKMGEYDMSEAGQLLNYILTNGPLVGVFTILQIDNLDNLKRSLERPLSNFAHRVALQMEETASMSVINSNAANKLFVMNRPSSKYRCYYYNNDKNILTKFKPYK